MAERYSKDGTDRDEVDCCYCGAVVSHGDEVPSVDDNGRWASLAAEHGDGCEWVETRAHRMPRLVAD